MRKKQNMTNTINLLDDNGRKRRFTLITNVSEETPDVQLIRTTTKPQHIAEPKEAISTDSNNNNN